MKPPKAALAAAPEIARCAGPASISVHTEANAEKELKTLQKRGGWLLVNPISRTFLTQIDPPPPIIAMRGEIALFEKPAIAIKSARNAAAAG